MPATTIKLPAELKGRIAALIEGSGKSMHAFLLEAVEERTRLAERRQRFVEEALAARAESMRAGSGYDAGRVHAWMRSRLAGKKRARPRASSWRK